MSANPMSLRRAVEIVEAGEPREVVWQDMGALIVDQPDPRRVAEWDRARSILAAAVEAHEALGELDDDDVPGAVAALRKLERGE